MDNTKDNTNPSPVSESSATAENKPTAGSYIGTILILVLIILGALYFWGKRLDETKQTQILKNQNTTSATTIIKY